MAIDNTNVIDGMGTDEEGKVIRLLLTDHLAWKEDDGQKYLDFLKARMDLGK